jgi:RNA polymerase sigma factor (sigma-70 family)
MSEFNRQLVEQLPRLRKYALMLTRNPADADDLVQTTTVNALRARAQFSPGTNFGAWTRTILRNRFMSDCRSNRRKPINLDEVPEMALANPDHMDDSVLLAEAIRAMEQLTPRLREMLGLICGRGLSYGDAARILSCSVGTVKSRLWRARQHMKALMSEIDCASAPPVAAYCG